MTRTAALFTGRLWEARGIRAAAAAVKAAFTRTIGGHDVPPPPSLPAQSEAISIARVLCILGIVYAHAWTGRNGVYILENSTSWQGMLRFFFVETIGRSSVPLLGMVSGWLVAGSARKRGYWQFVQGKARTILAPALIWNLLSVILVGGSVYLGWTRGPRILNGWGVFEELTSFTTFNHINFQTPFLRDLFVCMLLAPILVRVRTAYLLALLPVVAWWAIADRWFPLIIRPQVGLFFLIGLVSRRLGVAERV